MRICIGVMRCFKLDELIIEVGYLAFVCLGVDFGGIQALCQLLDFSCMRSNCGGFDFNQLIEFSLNVCMLVVTSVNLLNICPTPFNMFVNLARRVCVNKFFYVCKIAFVFSIYSVKAGFMPPASDGVGVDDDIVL